MYKHLHTLDARVIAAVDLGRLALSALHEVADIFVLPVAQLHGAAFALCSVSVGGDDGLVLRRP